MSKKQSLMLCYALLLSIALVVVGFVGLGVRAFASAGISNTIFLAIVGIIVAIPPIYFVLRRPGAAIEPIIFRRTLQKTSWPNDRRKPLARGQEQVAFPVERRREKGAELLV